MYGYYLVVFPLDVIKYNSEELRTTESEYNAGQELFVGYNFCKYGDYSATVYPELIGDSIVPMESFVSQIKPGCYNLPIALGFIPLHTPEGNYHLRIISRYRINAFKIITYTIETESFHVKDGQIIYL